MLFSCLYYTDCFTCLFRLFISIYRCQVVFLKLFYVFIKLFICKILYIYKFVVTL